MSARSVILPIRAFSRPRTAQWTCRRCLATQAEPTSMTPSLSGTLSAKRVDLTTDDPSRMSKRGKFLDSGLPHATPVQYLLNTSDESLAESELEQRKKLTQHRPITGVVVSTGKMDKTVKVRVPGQIWNRRIKKFFDSHTNHLVHDPNNSLVPGDVVSLHRLRVSSAVYHVVASIVTPFGTPIESRPPIPTPEERLAFYKEKRLGKLLRRSLRRKAAAGDLDAVRELRNMGVTLPATGHESGTGAATGKNAKSQKRGGESKKAGKGGQLGRGKEG